MTPFKKRTKKKKFKSVAVEHGCWNIPVQPFLRNKCLQWQ